MMMAADHPGLLRAPYMSAFYLDMVAINPKREEIRSEPVRVMVDSGSALSWMPAEALSKAGITPRRKRRFRIVASGAAA
jgi:hypothetical protein